MSPEKTREPSGLEQLLAMAALDERFAAALEEDRARAIEASGLALSPTERQILVQTSAADLQRMTSSIRRGIPDARRRDFLSLSAAALIALVSGEALGSGGGGGGRASIGGIRPGVAPRLHRGVAGPGVKVGSLQVTGPLDPRLVRRVCLAHRSELHYLYLVELQKTPKLEGKLLLVLVISPTGKIAVATVRSSTLKNYTLEQRVLSAIKRWLFPGSSEGQGSQVSLPLEFLLKV